MEACHTTSSFYIGKNPAFAFATGLPFGLNTRQQNAWMYHGGGLDLIFPHHENEIAQSRCAHAGAPLARFWVHNGFVDMGAEKMSKSLGNIIPLRAAIKENGADMIRLAMLVSAEILQDADFSFDTIRGIRSKLLRIFEMAEKCADKKKQAAEMQQLEDRWLASRLQHTIAETSASMDRLRTREAIHHILYSLDQDLQWYLRRAAAKGQENIAMLAEFLDVQVRMLAPFAPFTAEEVWERMGNRQQLITAAGWPEVREDRIDLVAEESEFLISSLLVDLQNIVKVTKITPSKIAIYTSAGWKAQVYKTILASILEGKTNFGEIMKQLIANPETAKAKTEPKLVQ